MPGHDNWLPVDCCYRVSLPSAGAFLTSGPPHLHPSFRRQTSLAGHWPSSWESLPGATKGQSRSFRGQTAVFFYLPPPNCLNPLPWKRGDRKGNVCYRRRKQRLTAKRAAHHATSLPREQTLSGWDWESGEGEETGAWCIPIAFPPTCRHSTHNFSEWILSLSLPCSLPLTLYFFVYHRNCHVTSFASEEIERSRFLIWFNN